MSADYLIDCGNSRSKIAKNNEALQVDAVADADLDAWFQKADAGTVLLLAGNAARADHCEAAAKAAGMQVDCVDARLRAVHCGQYEGMGLDRLSAGIAAVQECQSDVIVIDAGTMLTLSAWRHSAQHDFSCCFVDGFIFPGAQVCLDAMHRAAPALPQVDLAVTGQTETERQMQGAVRGAWPAAVSALLERLLGQVTTAHVLVTGGARAYLPASLLGMQREHLVLRGLQLLSA